MLVFQCDKLYILLQCSFDMVIFGNVYRDSMCLFLKILIHFNLLLINLYDISIMICNFTTVKVLVCVLCGLCYVCLCACRHLRCWCRCAMMPRRTCGVSVPLSTSVSPDVLRSRLRRHNNWSSSMNAILTFNQCELRVSSTYDAQTSVCCRWLA